MSAFCGGRSSLLSGVLTSISRIPIRGRAAFRFPDCSLRMSYPNYKRHLTHRRHFHEPHTFGIQRQTRLRCVDNSDIGAKAMAQGRPPKVIQVYSWKHKGKPHGSYGQVGDVVLCAVAGEKVKGIVTGLTVKPRLDGYSYVPRFDTNNVVLVDNGGNPLGTRILAPIPICMREKLKRKSNVKTADYTKLFSIATKFV